MSDYLDKIRRAKRNASTSAAVQVAVQIVTKTYDVFDPSIGPCVLDTDFYAGYIDFRKARSNRVSRAVIRVGQGGKGIDSQLKNSQINAKGVVGRDYYWYLDIHQSANGQARDCLRFIDDDFDEDSILFADFEDQYSFGRGAKYEHLNTGFLHGFLDTVHSLKPDIRLGIYTGLSFWATYGSKDPIWQPYPLWLSWPIRPYKAPPPLAPWGTYWYYHQWSYAGDESLYCAPDLNYQKVVTA